MKTPSPYSQSSDLVSEDVGILHPRVADIVQRGQPAQQFDRSNSVSIVNRQIGVTEEDPVRGSVRYRYRHIFGLNSDARQSGPFGRADFSL